MEIQERAEQMLENAEQEVFMAKMGYMSALNVLMEAKERFRRVQVLADLMIQQQIEL